MLCQTSKIIAMRIFIFILFLLVLLGCSKSDDYIGTYVRKHKYGIESVTLYPDHSFLQIYTDKDRLDSNVGKWYIKSNFLVLDGRIMYEAPIQIENANYIFGVGKRRTTYLEVSNKCIIVEIDFPEFNLCKK